MTKEQAIYKINTNRERYLFKPGRTWGRRQRDQRIYTRGFSFDIIRMLKESPKEDPVEILIDFQYQMDDLIATSENRRTWEFAGYMYSAASDILDMIR